MLTPLGSTTESSPVPSSTTVELGVLVESGTSWPGVLSVSSPPQVALVGAAEAKMAKKVRKKRMARVEVETERDIVTN